MHCDNGDAEEAEEMGNCAIAAKNASSSPADVKCYSHAVVGIWKVQGEWGHCDLDGRDWQSRRVGKAESR
jgi:hypothetical protein